MRKRKGSSAAFGVRRWGPAALTIHDHRIRALMPDTERRTPNAEPPI
jgi:hypothetical protein